MTGVYTSTERLKNSGITGKVMNRMQAAALEAALTSIRESLPEYILKEKGLVPIHYALRNIHFPSDMAALEKAKYRLKFEELFFSAALPAEAEICTQPATDKAYRCRKSEKRSTFATTRFHLT